MHFSYAYLILRCNALHWVAVASISFLDLLQFSRTVLFCVQTAPVPGLSCRSAGTGGVPSHDASCTEGSSSLCPKDTVSAHMPYKAIQKEDRELLVPVFWKTVVSPSSLEGLWGPLEEAGHCGEAAPGITTLATGTTAFGSTPQTKVWVHKSRAPPAHLERAWVRVSLFWAWGFLVREPVCSVQT